MYNKAWCTCRVVVLLYWPTAFWRSSRVAVSILPSSLRPLNPKQNNKVCSALESGYSWWKPACSSEYPQKCRNQIALQRRCSEYATQAYLTNCAWSHTAPTVGYKTWIMNDASCFTRATLIETGVYDKFSFLLRASLTASSPFKDSVSFRLLLSRERNNILLEQNTCFWVYFRIISWLLFLYLGFVFPYFISLLVYLFFTIYI